MCLNLCANAVLHGVYLLKDDAALAVSISDEKFAKSD